MSSLSYSDPSFLHLMVSTSYSLHTLLGPVHFICGTGDTRREAVIRPARKVRLSTFDRRMASLGTLFGFVTLPAELVGIKAEKRHVRSMYMEDKSMMVLFKPVYSFD